MRKHMRRFREDKQKFKELILYISEKSATDAYFGATKLNKILFLSDFWAYAELGEPITGMEYMHLPYGPGPRKLLPIRQEMEHNGELAIQPAVVQGMSQKRPVNLRPPELSEFTAEQIALVDRVIDLLKEATGFQVSSYTHGWHGWIAAEDKETIPYETVFINDAPLTEFEIVRGKQLAARHGWKV